MSTAALREAYRHIYSFYTTHQHILDGAKCTPEYKAAARALIAALPAPEAAEEDDIRAVFEEVIIGNLEWAYHQSDGEMTMSEYVKATVGGNYNLSAEVAERLSQNPKPFWLHTLARRRRQ